MFLLKLALTNIVIVSCVMIGRRFPHLGGLIATMPLTSVAVLAWLYTGNPNDSLLIENYVKGVFWGIFPTIAFFGAAYICLRQGIGLLPAIGTASACWLAGALIHSFLLKK